VTHLDAFLLELNFDGQLFS
jgi:hypothetical protein